MMQERMVQLEVLRYNPAKSVSNTFPATLPQC